MKKITRKNSIIYNQLWINKLIEDQRMDLLPSEKPRYMLSIGEYIALRYSFIDDGIKITKSNSLLFEKEWIKKFEEEKLKLSNIKNREYSYGELLEIKYRELEILNKSNNPEKCLRLKNEVK